MKSRSATSGNSRWQIAIAILGSLLVGAALAPGAATAADKAQDVVVENTAENPVPVVGTVGLEPGSAVQVANGTDAPVPVSVQGEAVREPFQENFDLGFDNDSSSASVDIFTVPEGKRLVVEYFSASRQSSSLELQWAGPRSGCGFATARIPAVTLSNAVVAEGETLLHVGSGCELQAIGVIANHGDISEGTTFFINGIVSGWLEDA